MKKWSFLVASLLILGATATTFTSCVDTDEPEGILEMRKAKAEYIRALAAVENAKIAYQQAAAQSEAANADLLKAQAEVQKAQAEVAKAQAQSAIIQAEAAAKAAEIVAEGQKTLDEAKAEIAKAEAAKILAEAADEEARTQQLIAENQIKIKEYEAKLQVVLQNEETNLAKAKAQYEAALKDIAAMELVLSPKESAVLNAAKLAYTTAEGKLSAAYGKVIKAQKALLDAVYGDEDDYETLQKNLADAQAELAAMNQVVADLETLSNSMTVTDFEKQREALKQKYGYNTDAPVITVGGSYKVAIDSLNVLIAQAKADNVALEDAWKAAQTATKNAQTKQDQAEGKAAKDNVEYKTSAAEIKIANPEVATLVGLTSPLKFDEVKGTYPTISSKAAGTPRDKVAAWEKAVKDKALDAENIKVAECALAADEKALAEAQKAHKEAVENWTKMHQQYEDGKAIVTVETKLVDDAVKAYNTALTALEAKVAAYNKTYDEQTAAVAKALADATTAEYNKIVDAKTVAEQIKKAATWLSNATNAGIAFSTAEVNAKKTIAEVEALIKSKNSDIVTATASLAKEKQLDAEKVIKNLEASSSFKNALRDSFVDQDAYDTYLKTSKESAETAAKTAKAYTDAQTAMTKALADAQKAINEAITKADKSGVADKLAAMPKANADYAKLAKDNAQIIVDDKGKDVDPANQAAYAAKLVDAATAVGAKYLKPGDSKDIADDAKTKVTSEWVVASVELKDKATSYTATGKQEVVRKAIDEKTVAALTAVAYNKAYGEAAWNAAATKAFGFQPAHSEAKLADCKPGSTGAAVVAAQKTVDTDKNKLAANEDVKKLAADIAAVKATLEAEIKVADDAIKAAKDAVKAAQDAEKAAKDTYEATYNGFVKEQQALAKVKGYEDAVLTALNSAIAAYYNNTYVEYEDETGNIVRKQVKDVEDLKSWAKAQAKNYTKKAGKIEKQQDKIAKLEKVISRVDENDYESAAHDYIIADLEYDVELAKAEYDYIQSEFENAQANLAKVIEALGNGVAGVAGITEGTTSTGAQGGSSSYTGITSSGTSTNITL